MHHESASQPSHRSRGEPSGVLDPDHRNWTL